MIKASITILLYISFVFSVYSRDINFKHLTSDDGLVSNCIRDIHQDCDGFMWIGTTDGLCRYDGYTFLNFIYSPTDDASLCNNNITCIVEDNNENLWVGTRNGLNVLDRKTYKVKRAASFLTQDVEFGYILSLQVDGDSVLWIGTNTSGLYSLDLNTFELTNYMHSDSDTTSISHNSVNSIVKGDNHTLLLGTTDGFDVFDVRTQTFKHILKHIHVRNLSFYKDGSLFIGGGIKGKVFYTWSEHDGLLTHLLPIESDGNVVRSLADSEGNQWMAISTLGVVYQDALTQEKQRLVFNRFDDDGINSNTVICFYEDRIGNVWIGTFDSGINIVKQKDNSFIHVKDNFSTDGLLNNRVRSIYQDSEDDIWIGTKVDGALSKMDRKTLTFTHYRHDPTDDSSLNNDFVFCMTEDSPGYLWVGTSSGLDLFNKSTGHFEHIEHDADNINSIVPGSIFTLLKDGDLLYIGTTLGLDIYNVKTQEFIHYKHSADDDRTLSLDKVRTLIKDSNGDIWAGTIKGLNRYNKAQGDFDRFLNDPRDSLSISDNYILSVYEDKNDNLWIGTSLGINKMDRVSQTFKVYTTDDGLPGNSVKGILDDEEGNLWLSTNNGISKFNPETETFKNFNIHDGLQANEFSEHVHCKTSDGELIFGGNNGFNIFNPNDIVDDTLPPDLILTNFKISNEEVLINVEGSPLKTHISRCRELVLNHEQSDISFEYVTLSYMANQKSQYAYRLDGFDSQESGWNDVGAKREAVYTNLDPGNYVFRVKASNNDGYWNEDGISIHIKVLPAPWKSWWAYSIYIILIVGFIIGIWLFRIKRIKEDEEYDRNQENLKFFINVSHEFRTPLTLILNPIKKILNAQTLAESKEAAHSISFSANKLMHLVNQLLDFRKSDLGLLTLRVVKVDVVDYTHEIFNLFSELGQSKDIKFTFESQEESLDAWIDTEKYEKILYNLLSNAVKYTNSGGEVSLIVSKIDIPLRNNKIDTCLEIKVKDSGVGLSEEQIKHIFERFYSGEQSQMAVGVGLNYSNSLVKLHKGQISVDSQVGEGSTFIVRLPLGKHHFSEAEISHAKPEMVNNDIENSYLQSLEYDLSSVDTAGSQLSSSKNNLSSKKPVILIVEDNKALRQQLSVELNGLYNVLEAINGQDGLEKAEKYYPDLIISDVMMPIMDGIELCRVIKSSLHTCHIPVVLLTAKSLVENKIQGFKTGADEYMSKPFHMDMLSARVENLLLSRRKLKEKFSSSRVILPSKEVTSNNLDEEFLDKVTKIITENMTNPDFSMDDLRDKVKLSRAGFFNKIKAITSDNPSAFVRNVKLKYSAELLVKGDHSIKEIAYLSGFKSASYFSTSFNELFNQTPAQYQKSNTAIKFDA